MGVYGAILAKKVKENSGLMTVTIRDQQLIAW
jgi:hypothetical protein